MGEVYGFGTGAIGRMYARWCYNDTETENPNQAYINKMIAKIKTAENRDEIKKARNNLVKIFHPDSGTEPNHKKMCEVNDLYAEAEKRQK